jgi:hypothetical protein
MPVDLGWELRDPAFLLAGLLAPLVYLWARRIPSRVTYSSLDLPERAPRRGRAPQGTARACGSF